MTRPSIGRTVHFSPDGGNTIQAAIITRVVFADDHQEESSIVDLTIFPHDAAPYFKHDCKLGTDWNWPHIEGVAGKPGIGAEIVTTVEALEKKVEHIAAHLFGKPEQSLQTGGKVIGLAGDMANTQAAGKQSKGGVTGGTAKTKAVDEKAGDPADQSASQTA